MTTLDTAIPLAAPALPTSALGSLSPSRGSDFKSCPLKYRFRVLDRLDEKPSSAAVRGTLVHAVLEHLFDSPAEARTVELAMSMVEPSWTALLAERPDCAELFTVGLDGTEPDGVDLTAWLESARALVRTYFTLEDPTCFTPAERELRVEHVLDPAGVQLRGIIDRLDVTADGGLIVSDYKTGRSPGPGFEEAAFFGLKFYALLLWRTRGVIPRQLRLLYLADGVVLPYEPDEAQLRGFERMVTALWSAIRTATERGDWRPRKSKLCDWCDFQSLCPEFGGTLPPLPVVDTSLCPTVTVDDVTERI
ncbi:MAG TPA: PD-(D/E)XK nuclease family protein [Mycobacteriales bacterium]|nr:PD-(D/E)XK nuclease family protein [Mycobacteriales bacterium]